MAKKVLLVLFVLVITYAAAQNVLTAAVSTAVQEDANIAAIAKKFFDNTAPKAFVEFKKQIADLVLQNRTAAEINNYLLGTTPQERSGLVDTKLTKYLTNEFYAPVILSALKKISIELENKFAYEFFIGEGFLTPDDQKITDQYGPKLNAMAARFSQFMQGYKNNISILLMDNADGIDAFAKGGNLIVLSSYVPMKMGNFQQIALLGHEIAHLYYRHYVKWVIIDKVNELLLKKILETTPGVNADALKKVWKAALSAATLAYKRQCENDCDLWASIHTRKLGGSGLEMIDVLKSLPSYDEDDSHFNPLANDHPTPKQRINNINNAVAFFSLTDEEDE